MNFDDSSKKSFTELLLPFKTAFSRYWRVSWTPGLALFFLITVLAVRLPDYFVSDVLIFIQPQKISTKIVEAPEKEEQQERFEALVQELLSKPRLRSIVDKFDLYPEYRGVIGREEALLKLREDIWVEPIVSPSGKALSQTFKVSYRHHDAKTAYDVTKSLSNLFIEESIITQRSETQGTEEFLDAQLNDVRKRLEITETRVQQFIKANAGKLPNHRREAMARLENAQSQLGTNSQLMSANLARMDFLQKEINLQTKMMTAVGSVPSAVQGTEQASLDPAVELAQLEQAMVVLKSRYSERHPDVINTKKRIESLRARVRSELRDESSPNKDLIMARVSLNPATRALRDELNKLQVQTTALQKENEDLKRLIETLDSDIKAMPIKEQELKEIQRDYINAQDSYKKLLAAKEDAALQSSLVRSQKSSQFKIVDPASIPLIPAGPPRLIIAAIGLVLGLATFFLLPVLLFLLNGSYKFRDETEQELGVPVIGVIPPMSTPAVAVLRRKAATAALFASGLSFVCGSALIVLFTI